MPSNTAKQRTISKNPGNSKSSSDSGLTSPQHQQMKSNPTHSTHEHVFPTASIPDNCAWIVDTQQETRSQIVTNSDLNEQNPDSGEFSSISYVSNSSNLE